MAKGDLHIVGVVQQHDSITNDDMAAAADGKRLTLVEGDQIILWNGRLYVFACEPSPLWEATVRSSKKPNSP